MERPNILVVADKEDLKFLDPEKKSECGHLFWHVIDYSRLTKEITRLKELVLKYHIELLIYSRNDQVAKQMSIGPVTKKLKTGYSSFSGIDHKDRIAQMKRCFHDFLKCDQKLNFAVAKEQGESFLKTPKGTFSLIFDVEQLGGARYGLPRILNLLKKYNVQASFFLTNFVKKVYPNILEQIEEHGHEIGIHGRWHEYLSDQSFDEQQRQIKTMIEDFRTKIYGANFLGRMDEDTITALLSNKVHYFVYPLINYYRFLSYPKLSNLPIRFKVQPGEVWALPISVETYGLPWFAVKNMVDLALVESEKNKFRHLTILGHPFRDGNLQHIKKTECLLKYLTEKKLAGITLKELTAKINEKRESFPQVNSPESFIKPASPKISLPISRQDFLGMIPHNMIFAYQMVRKGRTLF